MNDDSVLLQWLIDHNDAWALCKTQRGWVVYDEILDDAAAHDKDPRECIRKAMKAVEAM